MNSEVGVDYTRLRDLLAAGNWKEVDYETYRVMLKVMGGKEDDWIREEELLIFPCTDLRTIDCLWVKYSNGRFGFSVQKKIYLEVGGIPDGYYYEKAWLKFSERVGWKVNQMRRSLDALESWRCGRLSEKESDRDTDGCYRCIRTYSQQYSATSISRERSIKLLKQLIASGE